MQQTMLYRFAIDVLNQADQLLSTYRNLPENLNDYRSHLLSSISCILELFSGILFELVMNETDSTCYKTTLSGEYNNLSTIISEIERYLDNCRSIILSANQNSFLDAPFTGMATDAQTLVFKLNDKIKLEGDAI